VLTVDADIVAALAALTTEPLRLTDVNEAAA
jgi:hypothetical protein